MLRYAITDRRLFPGDEQTRRSALMAQAVHLAKAGVEYVQLREKDLPEAARIVLAREFSAAVRGAGGAARLLFSGAPSAAIAAGADGVHLTSLMLAGGWRPHDFVHDGRRLIVSVSCHSVGEVRLHREVADVVLFAPVFEKRVMGEQVSSGAGLELLREACVAAEGVPVFALGGVDDINAQACLDAGAAGIAGIRTFLTATPSPTATPSS